ncbi:hypothetical protein D3C84_912780 [compost metagenome]
MLAFMHPSVSAAYVLISLKCVVAATSERFSSKCSNTAIDKAMPSPGSVPAANSSSSSSERSPAAFTIEATFVICAEKVLSDCSKFCPSPKSAITCWKTPSSLAASAGIRKPHW